MTSLPIGDGRPTMQSATGQRPFRLASPLQWFTNAQKTPQDFAPASGLVYSSLPEHVFSTGAVNSEVFIPLGTDNVVQLRFLLSSGAFQVCGNLYYVHEDVGTDKLGNPTVGYTLQDAFHMGGGAVAGATSLVEGHPFAEYANIPTANIRYADDFTIGTDFAFGNTSEVGDIGNDGVATLQLDYVGAVGLLFVGGPVVAGAWNIAYRSL